MDYEIARWIRALHVFGVLAWAGALVGLSFTLKAHAGAAEAARPDFIKLEKHNAIAMDIFATVAIASGLILLFGLTPSPLKAGGYMHAKLTALVGILVIHVVQRMRVVHYKKGEITPYPAWIIPVLQLLLIAIIAFVVAKPF